MNSLVLVFKANGTAATAARLHIKGCQAIKAGKNVSVIEGDEVAPNVEDLEERGFQVIRCKCIKA